MAKKYDRTLKRLCRRPTPLFLELVPGRPASVARVLPGELVRVESLYPDLVLELDDGGILQIEFQGRSEEESGLRMASYFVAIRKEFGSAEAPNRGKRLAFPSQEPRFLLEADRAEPLRISSESKDPRLGHPGQSDEAGVRGIGAAHGARVDWSIMRAMRTFFVFLIGSGILTADIVEQGPRNAKPSGLMAGVARAEINPPIGIPHLNWGSQTHVESIGIDPMGMLATALVLSDGKQTFAMVDVDTLLVYGFDDIIARASRESGIPAEHIRIAATHTHAGPMFQREKGPVGVDPAPYERMMREYRQLLADRITSAIVEAKKKLQPAHAWGARGTGTINQNRRVRTTKDGPPAVGLNPEGFVDRELVVMRIDDAHGNPYAVLVNFQCHGTVLTYENKMISPDWVGMVRKTVEQAMPGSTALFFQGAAGNQGPEEGGTGDLSVAHRLGRIIGLQAAALAAQTETVDRKPTFEGYVESTAFAAKQPWRVAGPRDQTLRFVKRTLDLPPRQYTPAEIKDMEKRTLDAELALGPARASGDPWKKHQAEAKHRRFADLLAKWRKPYDPTPVKVDVQILRLGNMAIAAMPGEPFAEIGVGVKKASPFGVTMFCGYSTGKGGDYMPIDDEYRHGGYEVERTPYGTGAAEKLIREMSALYRELR